MKLIAAMIFISSFASAQVIKTCSTVLIHPENNNQLPTTFEIIKEGSRLQAKVTQTFEGQSQSYTDKAATFNGPVRTGLHAESDIEKLNLPETLVVHAMALEGPEFGGRFKSGIDLKKVRSAKVFVVGETTNMGSSSIVEARDSKGKILGSFLGGFLVSPCK